MAAVSVTYILTSDEGFGLDHTVSCIAGAVFAAVLLLVYLAALARRLWASTLS